MAADTAPLLDFIGYVVRSLVENADEVDLIEVEEGRQTVIELSVHPDDQDAITGEDDVVADALRTVLDACAYKHRVRAELVILDALDEPGDEDEDELDEEDEDSEA
jgi:uncharacterized protein